MKRCLQCQNLAFLVLASVSFNQLVSCLLRYALRAMFLKDLSISHQPGCRYWTLGKGGRARPGCQDVQVTSGQSVHRRDR